MKIKCFSIPPVFHSAMLDNPRKVIVKTMTVKRSVDDVFDFFEDPKSMEIGGSAKNVAKGKDGWWTFDHVVAGRAKMKHMPAKEAGVLDHVFSGAGMEWKVYVRIIPNQGGATVTWTFIRPAILTDGQFEKQLEDFDREIALWKKALEGRQN
jgi:hypothetical protein